jgi:hypothetical protein
MSYKLDITPFAKKGIALILLIVLWEIGILWWSYQMSSDVKVKYLLAARYSARTSFFMVSGILLWIGFSGLRTIYARENLRKMFILMLLLFAVNHLIHFIYLAINLIVNDFSILKIKNLFGAIAYISLTLAPIYLWDKKVLTKALHQQIATFLLLVFGVFLLTYVTRFSADLPLKSSNSYFYFGIITIILIVALNVFRFFKEMRDPSV